MNAARFWHCLARFVRKGKPNVLQRGLTVRLKNRGEQIEKTEGLPKGGLVSPENAAAQLETKGRGREQIQQDSCFDEISNKWHNLRRF